MGEVNRPTPIFRLMFKVPSDWSKLPAMLGKRMIIDRMDMISY